MDLVLAATALADGWTLVSSDTIYAEVLEIERNLRLENWLESPKERSESGGSMRSDS